MKGINRKQLVEILENSAVKDLNEDLYNRLTLTTPKKAKYNACKTEVDGIKFDSLKEANRYKHLCFLMKQGLIGLLRLQVPYELNEGGSHSMKYFADFVYVTMKTGETVVEDVKGYRTAVYKKKKRLMKKVYGIEIKEV